MLLDICSFAQVPLKQINIVNSAVHFKEKPKLTFLAIISLNCEPQMQLQTQYSGFGSLHNCII